MLCRKSTKSSQYPTMTVKRVLAEGETTWLCMSFESGLRLERWCRYTAADLTERKKHTVMLSCSSRIRDRDSLLDGRCAWGFFGVHLEESLVFQFHPRTLRVSRGESLRRGEPVRRDTLRDQQPRPPSYLARHAREAQPLAREAKEIVNSVRALLEDERESP